MQELVKIMENDGKQAVSARELYGFLELDPAHFARWAKSNISENQYAEENVDFQRLTIDGETPTGGRIERTDYALTIPFAKKICMMSKTENGEKLRDYFIECERKWKDRQKPLDQFEFMQYSLNVMIEQNKRLSAVESKVDSIIERQIENENELKALPVSTEKVPEMTLRDRIRLLVTRYSNLSGLEHKDVWNHIYQTLYYNYHVSLKSCKKDKGQTWLDVAEDKGHLDKIYAIVSDLLTAA